MISKYKPLSDSYALISGFYEKAIYKTRRHYKLRTKHFSLLHLSYCIQRYRNGFVTCGALRPYAPVNIVRIKSYIAVLVERGYMVEVEPPTRRKDRKGIDKNVFYNVTESGEKVVNHFTRLLTSDISKFKSNHKWKQLNPNSLDHFESMGVLRSKPGSGKKKDSS